ncbi:MAG TPA: EamA family transporter [Dongiaceae bacterium]|jgi:O-acetylserine/cysteine efflux transporter|nr:EamA family transporter [Dongiaceae bacterium]
MRPQHFLALAVAQIFWGANFAIVKLGLETWPTFFFVGLRLAAVGIMLTPFVGLPKRRQLPGVLGLAFMLGVVHFGTLFSGIRLADAATSSILIQIQVPLSALAAAAFFGDRIGWRRWSGMGLSLLGIALLVGRPAFQGGWIAVALILVAAVAWIAANMQIKRLAAEIDGWRLNAWIGLFAAPMLFVLSALTEHGQVAAIRDADTAAWFSMAYQVIVTTALCYGLWYAMMRRYPVSVVMPFTLLEPVFGALSGVLLLGESWDWQMVLGALVTVSGLAIIVIRRPESVEQPVGPGA